jgi:hypothetical protein
MRSSLLALVEIVHATVAYSSSDLSKVKYNNKTLPNDEKQVMARIRSYNFKACHLLVKQHFESRKSPKLCD